MQPQSAQQVFNRPNNAGKEIIIFTRYGKAYVGIFTVVILEDHEGYQNKYKTEIEACLASVEFKEN